MHILLIPSEEFLPPYNQLDGIFQYHQGKILNDSGHRVGVLSVKLSFSIPMISKAIFLRLLGRRAGNEADCYSISSLLKLGWNKLMRPASMVTREQIDDLKVYRIDGLFVRPPRDDQNHLSWVRAGITCFKSYLKGEGRPDVIHAHNALYAGLLAQRIKTDFNLEYIITEHSSVLALRQIPDSVLSRVKACYQAASGLFAVSESFTTFLNEKFDLNRFKYLPNVLDQKLEDFKYEPVKLKGERFVFLHVAGLLPVKDQSTLLNAFKKVADVRPNAALHIGGSGELLDNLSMQTRDLGLLNSVTFLGQLNREQVIDSMQNCNCFVLSSKYETFGVVVIEAMLFGKPVIVTRCGIGPTIVTEKVGFVTEVGDVNHLAQAMLQMMDEYDRFNSSYIRKFTIENFGKQQFIQRMNAIYHNLKIA